MLALVDVAIWSELEVLFIRLSSCAHLNCFATFYLFLLFPGFIATVAAWAVQR